MARSRPLKNLNPKSQTCLLKDGDPASAESFLSLLMQSSNGKSKTVACTMLIDAYGKFGDVKGAEKFLAGFENMCFVARQLWSTPGHIGSFS